MNVKKVRQKSEYTRACHSKIKVPTFDRATLCITRTMLSQDVRPSVRPSVRHRPARCIIKHFPPSSSHTKIHVVTVTYW